MITVEQALEQLFALVTPLPVEHVPLQDAAGRALAQPVTANRDQPPFAASVMDGYAMRNSDAMPGAQLTVIGEAAAGHAFNGTVGPGQSVRIFTGAPMPDGADRVVIQEDVSQSSGGIKINSALDPAPYVRAKGADFQAGSRIASPHILRPADIALLASMNIAKVPVARRPVVALIATGDELVMPSEAPEADQIIASNSFGLKALIESQGAETRLLPIARDSFASLETVFDLAAGADLIITIGGASVGDHDLVAKAAEHRGLQRSFYKIAMRPGKPLMAGRMGDSVMIGLPGNPVSSMVCGQIFVLPLLNAMLGLGQSAASRKTAKLACNLPANGPREHYMRAQLTPDGISPFERQDSALLGVLAQADALLIRPIKDRARQAGEQVEYIAL